MPLAALIGWFSTAVTMPMLLSALESASAAGKSLSRFSGLSSIETFETLATPYARTGVVQFCFPKRGMRTVFDELLGVFALLVFFPSSNEALCRHQHRNQQRRPSDFRRDISQFGETFCLPEICGGEKLDGAHGKVMRRATGHVGNRGGSRKSASTPFSEHDFAVRNLAERGYTRHRR